ncbi:MAG: energy transducer TonB [Acidobacteriota bacterium]
MTKRGSEIGGVLAGHVLPGNPRTVVIDRFEPVECDYSRGPLFLLADADKERLKDAIDRVRSSGAVAAGFFRSNTRRDIALDEEDLAIISEHFSDPANVALLVRPFAMKPSAGAFFIWEDGKIQGDASYLQFPFKRAELLKSFAQFIVDGSGAGPAPQAKEPLVMPKREEPAPVAKREEPPQITFKREERPAIIPVSARREDRPPLLKREERPAGPTLVSKKEEKPQPAPKREEKAAITLAPPKPVEEKPAVTPAAPPVVPAAPVPPPPVPPPAAEKKELVSAPAEPEPAKPEHLEAAALRSPAPAFAEAVEEPEERSLFSKLKWVIILLVVAAVGAGGYFAYLKFAQPAPEAAQPSDSTLALKVERSAGQLLLSWNRNSPIIATATRATLSITDGDHKEDVDLDLGQLHNGSIVYAPMTNDVSFRLEVTDLKNGKSAGESVRVLAGRPSPSVSALPPSMAKPAAGAADPKSVPAATPAQNTEAQAAPHQQAQTPPPVEQPKVTAGPAVTAAPPSPESLAARLRAAEPQELPAPPKLEGSSSALGAAAPIGAQARLPGAPPAPQPASPQAQPQQPAPVAGGRAIEAKLIRRVAPVYPGLARQTRVSGIVRVRATVGKDGKVKKAVAVSGPPLLRQSAIEAVRLWLYTPAMLNGEPIDSETQVDVSFML